MRPAARGARRRDRREPPEARPGHPQPAQGARARRADRTPPRGAAARRRRPAARDRRQFAANALAKARAAAAATGRAGDRRRLGHRGRGARRAPRRALGALRGRGRDATRRTSPSWSARRPAGSPLAYVCALAYVAPDGERARRSRAAARARLAPDAPRDGRLRLRPGLPARRRPRRAHHGRARARREGAISHRGRAARALVAWLDERGMSGGPALGRQGVAPAARRGRGLRARWRRAPPSWIASGAAAAASDDHRLGGRGQEAAEADVDLLERR